MKFATKAVHAGVEADQSTGAVMTPIYQTSTYKQHSPGKHKGYEYGRTQNPTRTALQNSIAGLENAKHGICYASGLAAIDALIKTLDPGDEVICADDLYGGTYRLFTNTFGKYGIKFAFNDLSNPEVLESLITDDTRLLWIETPTNPMMNIIDIKRTASVARKHKIMLAVDNTFATPYLQNPLDLGAGIVMHSVTKYLGGHSDIVMGALATNNDDLAEKLVFIQNSSGAVPGPQDCFLALRGIKTLHLRMQRHSENAAGVAGFLNDHPAVGKVYWPGLKKHPNHEVTVKQMRDFGGMVSFSLKEGTKEAAFKFLEKVNVFTLGESLGGVESLANHPATMTHASMPNEIRTKLGITDSLIRLSVGIEDINDLLQDLEQALKKNSGTV